jgi:hypothetical protein
MFIEIRQGRRPSRQGQRRIEMPSLQKGDFANALAKDGHEVKVRIVDQQDNGRFVVQVYDENDQPQGPTQQAEPSSLLPLRGAYFEVRGQVLTTSATHPNEVGEIVKMGTSKSGKAFYCVQFADGVSEWLSDDQVFIDNAVLPAGVVKKAKDKSEG